MVSRRQFFKKMSTLAFLPVVGPFIAPVQKQETFLFEGFVAGFSYYDGEKVLGRLEPGNLLILKREPGNPYDRLAIEIYTRGGVKLGYVPRDINAVPAALLDQSVELKVSITEINLPPAPDWERVRFEVVQRTDTDVRRSEGMKVIRTSRTDPLRIDSVQPKGMTGRIGMTLCPGKIQTNARGGEWRRDLREDLRCIQNWEAVALLNLLTPAEIRDLGISEIEEETKQLGILYFHLPMEDGGIPDAKGENIWREISSFLRSRLKAGENVVVHCKGGLGRTGTMAARLLVETGSDSKAAVRAVRKARPGAIENALQENYIHKLTLPQKEGVLAALTSWISQPQTGKQVKKRFLGCLLGGAVGDALGAPVEFMKLSEIRERFGPKGIQEYEIAYGRRGAITDDTQMTLFTAEGLIRADVRGCSKGITSYSGVTARAYLRWLRTQGEKTECGGFSSKGNQGWLFQQKGLHQRRAPGNTCITALKVMRHFGDPAQNNSKGCGGVMRVAPAGLFAWHWRNKQRPIPAFELARDIAALTHGHPTGSLTAGVLAVMILALADGASLQQALKAGMECLAPRDGHEETLQALNLAVDLSKSDASVEQAISRLGREWVAEEALAIGVYCALKAQNFREGVLMAVNHDGDSDSTGAIAGNLLGTMFGVEAIPQAWLEDLELRGVIEELATDLFEMKSWPLYLYGDGSDSKKIREAWAYAHNKYPGW